jgi:CHAT domain-containing protein
MGRLVLVFSAISLTAIAQAPAAEQQIREQAGQAAIEAMRALPPPGNAAQRAAAIRALPAAEDKVRNALAAFPAERALALASLAEINFTLKSHDHARELALESVALVEGRQEFYPSEAVEVNASYAEYLIATNQRAEAARRLKLAAELCARTFSDVSASKKGRLLNLAGRLRWLGDRQAAAEIEALAARAGNKRDGPPMPMPYLEERRATWRGAFAEWRAAAAEASPSEARLFEALRNRLDDDWKWFPVDRAHGLIEIAELQVDRMQPRLAAQSAREARALVERGPEHFPEVEVNLLVVEGRILLAKMQLEDATLAFATAWRKANALLPAASPLRGPFAVRFVDQLLQAARPRAALVLLKGIDAELRKRSREKTPDDVDIAMRFVSAYLAEGDLDAAEQAANEAISLANSLAYAGSFRPLPGGSSLSPEPNLHLERLNGVGRYRQMHHLRILRQMLAGVHVARRDFRGWQRIAEESLRSLREFPGEDTREYVSELDAIAFYANQMPLKEFARALASSQIDLLKRNPQLEQHFAVRARMILEPEFDDETVERKVARLRDTVDKLSDSPAVQATYRIQLHDVLKSAGRTAEANLEMGEVLAWRDSRVRVTFDPDAIGTARRIYEDAMPLSGLLNRLVSMRNGTGRDDPRRSELLEQVFLTAQVLTGRTTSSAAVAQLAARAELGGDDLMRRKLDEYRIASAELERYDRLALESLGHSNAAVSAPAALDEARTRVRMLGAEIEKIGAEHPSVAHYGPITMSEAQQRIGAQQALVLFFMSRDWEPDADVPLGHAIVLSRSHAEIVPLCARTEYCHDGRAYQQLSEFRRLVTPPPGRGQAMREEEINGVSAVTVLSRSLYEALWLPVQRAFVAMDLRPAHVVIVPDPALELVPFAALASASLDDQVQRWLIQDHALSLMPSVRAFASVRGLGNKSRLRPTLVALGDPKVEGAMAEVSGLRNVIRAAGRQESELGEFRALPEASEEVCSLADVVGRMSPVTAAWLERSVDLTIEKRCEWLRLNSDGKITLLRGVEANKPRLLELSRVGRLRNLGILAFATHGVSLGVDRDDPALLLSQTSGHDRFLRLIDIAGLSLDTDLVVLSACRTADVGAPSRIARQSPTLAAAFMQAGGRSVLATLTDVHSDAAATLVSGVIQRAVSYSETMAVALQGTIVDAIASGHRVQFWSPLVLYGVD